MSDETNIVNMAATAAAALPPPPAEELVTDDILQSTQRSTLSLANGFSGTSDPSVIWQAMIRDHSTAFVYYRELEEKDDDVSSALEMLKLAVLSRDRQIVAADESPQAQEAADFIQAQIAGVPSFHEVLEAMLDAPAYGVHISEVMYDVSAGQVSLIDIKDRPQELFSFNPQYQLQTGPLRLLSNPFSFDGGELVPEQKFLIFSFRPRSGNRRGRPLLRRVFWPSWFKRQALRFWLRFGEKGPGTAAVMYPSGANPDEKRKALAAAEAIVEKIAIAVPENFQMVKELLTSARTQNPSVYKQLIDDQKYQIARAIVGQTLTLYANEGGTGSRSMGTTHAKMFYLKEIEVAIKLQAVINDQLVRPLTLWNFGPTCPVPKFTITTEDEQDLVQRIGIDSQAQAMGVPITKQYMQETYGYPEPGAQDQILVRPQGASAGAISSGAAQTPSFSDREAIHNAKEVQQLLDSLRVSVTDQYAKRIHEIAAAVQGGGLQ
jgi:phage gp29-like protein